MENNLINFNIPDANELLEHKSQISKVPVGPMYLGLKKLDADTLTEIIPYTTPKQRSAFLDIDLWVKDDLDVSDFGYWLETYSHLKNNPEIQLEFAKSDQFQLYLKSKLNIYTFDLEDPEYPDHDNYFLTEDNLLLFEYDENYPYAEEIQEFVKLLYSELGVENAYTFLFKAVADNFYTFCEDQYQNKKSRMQDLGFVDYYDSLSLEAPFRNIEEIKHFILTKKGDLASLDPQLQSEKRLISINDTDSELIREINNLENDRKEYLDFSLFYTINSSMAYSQGYKKGSVAIKNISERVHNRIELGHSYIKTIRPEVFKAFDFRDLYKVGNSLIRLAKNRLNKVKEELKDSVDKGFLGQFWDDFITDSLDEGIVKIHDFSGQMIIDNKDSYDQWHILITSLEQWAPFSKAFYKTYLNLKSSGSILEGYYLNYSVEEISFETLLLSCFFNTNLGKLNSEDDKKLGITVEEFNEVLFKIKNDEVNIPQFLKSFGMDKVTLANEFLEYLIDDHLGGYDLAELQLEDYKHVGGPLILNYIH